MVEYHVLTEHLPQIFGVVRALHIGIRSLDLSESRLLILQNNKTTQATNHNVVDG